LVADRGEVLRLKRRLGFAAQGEAESVVVVQANPLNAVLATLLVVPLDPAVGAYGNHPAVLRVSREEAGSRVEHVAVPWRLRAVSADSFLPGPVGRLRPRTLQALEDLLKLVLDLP
jgi:mRNA-degrading endonuclease toxin of MazEF toxin-antitoxin module